MPAIYAHYMFGSECLALLPQPVQSIVRCHRTMFDAGLQGPDFYFFDQFLMLRGKRYARLGSVLHEASCASLLERLEGSGGRRPDSAALAYLFGLIGHFALDSTCHPHIDRWVAELSYDHHRLETEFDRYLLQRAGIGAPRRFALGTCITAGRRECLAIGRLYEAAGLGEARDIVRLFLSFRWIKDHTSLSHDAAYRVLHAALSPLGVSGILMGPKDALSDVTNRRLMALFDEAKACYARLVENYYVHIFEGAVLDAYFQRNFETEDL